MLTNPEIRKIIFVAATALCLLALAAYIRPVEDHGLPQSNFWTGKLSTDETYDVVAIGDSRVLHGISMEPFSDLNIGKGLNFGFRGAASNIEYIEAAVNHLADDGPRILLIGFTPNSFTEYAIHSNDFDQKKKEYASRIASLPNWLGHLEQRLQPMTLGEGIRIISGRKHVLQLTYHSDGWIESAHETPNTDKLEQFYNVHFDNNLASPEIINSVLQYLEECIDNDVRIFAFRPPLSESVQNAEDLNSGFDYPEFAKKLAETGVVWLEVNPAKYETYDGSHLNHHSAREFSQWLAESVQTKLALHQKINVVNEN